MRLSWRRLSVSVVIGAVFAAAAGAVYAASPSVPGFFDIYNVPILGSPLGPKPNDGFNSFDISFVDTTVSPPLLYVADRSDNGVDEFNTQTGQYVTSFLCCVGNITSPANSAGPNGLFTGPSSWIWVGDGNSAIKVINKANNQLVVIPTGGKFRADEGAWDPVQAEALVANDADIPPFVTIVSGPPNFAVLGQVFYDGSGLPGHGPNAAPGGNPGIEQPQWYPPLNEFLISIPSTTTNLGGEVDAISPVAPFTVTTFSTLGGLKCGPAGLSIGPNGEMLVGCASNQTLILNQSGTVIANLPQITGSDEVYYNAGNNMYYTGSSNNPAAKGGPSLGVISAANHTWIGNVATASGSHSVAAEPIHNQVYVPLKEGAAPNTTGSATNGGPVIGGVAVYQ